MPETEKSILRTGNVYLTEIENVLYEEDELRKRVYGNAFYLGRGSKDNVANEKTVTFNREGVIETYSFKRFSFDGDKLRIPEARKVFPSPLEMEILEKNFKRALAQRLGYA